MTSLPSVAGPWNVFVEGDNLAVLPGLEPERRPDLHRPAVQHGQRVRLPRPLRRARTDGLGGDDAAAARGGARRCSRETGAIFVSIDDHEVAHLRLLLDEVYGEQNFLAQIVVNLNPKGRQLGSGFATSHEYLLVYARDARHVRARRVDRRDRSTRRDFPLRDADGRRLPAPPAAQHQQEVQPGHRAAPCTSRSTATRSRAGSRPTPFAGSVEVVPVFGDGSPAVWRWSRPRIDERPDDLVCRTVAGRLGERVDVFQKDWLHRRAGARRKKLRTIWLRPRRSAPPTPRSRS